MAISEASDSIIEAATNYHLGHPGHKPDCNSNYYTDGIVVVDETYYYGMKMYWVDGEVFSLSSTIIRTRLDSGLGMSGGPIFYYPYGYGGSHFITGLMSGYTHRILAPDYTGGPKGPAIRAWVINHTP